MSKYSSTDQDARNQDARNQDARNQALIAELEARNVSAYHYQSGGGCNHVAVTLYAPEEENDISSDILMVATSDTLMVATPDDGGGVGLMGYRTQYATAHGKNNDQANNDQVQVDSLFKYRCDNVMGLADAFQLVLGEKDMIVQRYKEGLYDI